MKYFDAPVSKFRDIIRNAGDGPLGFFEEDQIIDISSTWGETNMLRCENNCFDHHGYYALISPKSEQQPYIQILYQCCYCDTLYVRNYGIGIMDQYTKLENVFLRALFLDVIGKRVDYDIDNYEKRKKYDIYAQALVNEDDEIKLRIVEE